MTRAPIAGWSSTEAYGPGGTVRFEQHARPSVPVVELSEEGALTLGRRYWDEVAAFTHRVVRACERGDALDLRLFGRWTLLRFGASEATVDESGALSRRPIAGGLLARRPGGSITFAQTVQPVVEVRVTVDGFVPRLGSRPGAPAWTGALYRHGQRRLHSSVSRRYLGRLIREAAR